MLRGIQVIGLLIGLFLLYQSYVQVKKKKGEVLDFVTWTIVGTGVITVSIYPGIFDFLLGILQMKERPFAIFTIGILVVYVLLFQFFKSIRALNENISKLNEEIAILRYKTEKKK